MRLVKATSTIEVDVRPRRGSKPHCSCCGSAAPGYDLLPTRRFPIWGYAVMLLYAMRWSTSCACREEGLEHRELGTLRAIGVDEIHSGHSHKFLTLVVNHAGEARRMVREGYEPVLKNKRWCLLKRPENLTDKQRLSLSLSGLLAYNLKSVRAYLLKEEFQLFWEYNSPAWAAKFLDAWSYWHGGPEHRDGGPPRRADRSVYGAARCAPDGGRVCASGGSNSALQRTPLGTLASRLRSSARTTRVPLAASTTLSICCTAAT